MTAVPPVDDLAAELADELAELGAPSPLAVEFTIDSTERAEWAVAKVARHRARLAEAENLAAVQRDRITGWIVRQRDVTESRTRYLEDLLRLYHERLLVEDPRAKTVELPSGKLTARLGRGSFVASDEFVEWARYNAETVLVRTVKADLNEVRAVFGSRVTDDGTVVTEDGVAVPGLTFTPPTVAFKVVTP